VRPATKNNMFKRAGKMVNAMHAVGNGV